MRESITLGFFPGQIWECEGDSIFGMNGKS
jgi:hypothetical protein